MPGAYLWGWYPTGSKWVKLKVDEDGSIHIVGYVDELNDIGDVNVAAPTDGYVLYWDETAGKFQLKAITTTFLALTDTPAAYAGEAGKVPQVNVGEDALEFVAAAAPTGFEEIGDIILTESAASIEFASIAAGFAFFLLIWHDIYGDNANLAQLQLTFNSDGGNNYDYFRGSYGGVVTTVHANASMIIGYCGDTDGDEAHDNGGLWILNRASQEKVTMGQEVYILKAGADAEDTLGDHLLGKWRNVADEISTITITPSVGNFVAGSRFLLVGVKT